MVCFLLQALSCYSDCSYRQHCAPRYQRLMVTRALQCHLRVYFSHQFLSQVCFCYQRRPCRFCQLEWTAQDYEQLFVTLMLQSSTTRLTPLVFKVSLILSSIRLMSPMFLLLLIIQNIHLFLGACEAFASGSVWITKPADAAVPPLRENNICI